ncbi:MAG: flagellar FlbD family protein [Deltaproteobacteria bacterium]|nr:flagellar FlbD family protein [Deltaproteobacteria bacterium]
MISVTRLKGQVVAINPDLIEMVEETPDTTVRLTSGDKILVRESLAEIVDRVVRYRKDLLSAFVVDPLSHPHPHPGARQPAEER